MARKYPLDPPETPKQGTHRGWLAEDGLAMRLAAEAAQLLLDIGEWRRRHLDLSQAIVGFLLLVLGLGLGTGAAITDSYLHRGVESGAERPYVVQPTAKTLATNVDLRPFTGDTLEAVAAALSAAGFQYVRHEVSWADVVLTRGSADWERYDQIVTALSRREIGIIMVIVDTPVWARPIGTAGFEDAPPRDPEMLGEFAEAVAARYRERVEFIQIGNTPNLASHWGGVPATGPDFAPYLEAAWRGARAGNASVRLVTPELAPASDTPAGQSDLDFVASLYDVGGERFFDILGIALGGGVYSPDDRRVDPSLMNMSRAILFRELMVNRGDSETPIWATSFGWAAAGEVSRDAQAEFVERGLERSWSEWPWMGLTVHWSFLAPEASPDHDFAILLPNGSPTPLYSRLLTPEIQERSRIANTGFMPMDFAGIVYSGDWPDQHLEGRTFRTTRQVGASVSFTFQGTGLIAYVRSGPQTGRFTIEVDGEVIPGGGGETGDEWDLSFFSTTNDFPRRLVDGLDDTRHTMVITLVSEGELTLGGLEVTRQAPFVWPIVLMTVGSLISLLFGLRSIAFLFATRAGHLRRKSLIEPMPLLGQLPERRA